MSLTLEVRELSPGVVLAESADPMDAFKLYRFGRHLIKFAPDEPGVYFLLGNGPGGEPKVYIGESESSLKGRLQGHKNGKKKEFFGEVFAVPIPDAVYCRAVEAELIHRAQEADNTVIFDNVAEEKHWKGAQPTQTHSLCERIQSALALLWGRDVFSDLAADPISTFSPSAAHKVTLMDLVEAGKIDKGEPLYAKGGELSATINDDGSLEFDGNPYASLSGAASDARVKLGEHPNVSGWVFWTVKRDGVFETLKKLRLELEGQQAA